MALGAVEHPEPEGPDVGLLGGLGFYPVDGPTGLDVVLDGEDGVGGDLLGGVVDHFSSVP